MIEIQQVDPAEHGERFIRLMLEAGQDPSHPRNVFASTESLLWLATDARRDVGGLLARMMDTQDGPAGGVDNMVVLASHRRRGIARELMETAEKAFRHAGALATVLNVRRDNEAARELYNSMGFEVVAERLRMWKRLD